MVNVVGTVPAGADFCLSMISPRYPPPPAVPPLPPLSTKTAEGPALAGDGGGGAEMLLCGPQRPAELGSAQERRVQTVTGMSHTHTHRLTHACVHTQRHTCTKTHAHVCTRRHTRTKTHAYIRAHAHTDTRAHTCAK